MLVFASLQYFRCIVIIFFSIFISLQLSLSHHQYFLIYFSSPASSIFTLYFLFIHFIEAYFHYFTAITPLFFFFTFPGLSFQSFRQPLHYWADFITLIVGFSFFFIFSLHWLFQTRFSISPHFRRSQLSPFNSFHLLAVDWPVFHW